MSNWIVELEPGVFLAPISGDPGRCLDARNARVYDSHPRARLALMAAQKLRPFEKARVTLAPLPDHEPPNVEVTGKPPHGAAGAR
jgi:hypothetical protein